MFRQGRLLQQRAVVLQNRQRGFEFMADIRDKIGAQGFHTGKFLRQGVEGICNHIKAILPQDAERRDAHRKIPPGDPPGRLHNLPHRAVNQKAAAHLIHNGAQQAEQQHIAKGQPGGPAELLLCEGKAERGLQLADEQRHAAGDQERHCQEKGQIPPQCQPPRPPAGPCAAHFGTAL